MELVTASRGKFLISSKLNVNVSGIANGRSFHWADCGEARSSSGQTPGDNGSTMTFGREHKQCFHIYALRGQPVKAGKKCPDDVETAGAAPLPKKTEQYFW
jgi:hypothetical protein